MVARLLRTIQRSRTTLYVSTELPEYYSGPPLVVLDEYAFGDVDLFDRFVATLPHSDVIVTTARYLTHNPWMSKRADAVISASGKGDTLRVEELHTISAHLSRKIGKIHVFSDASTIFQLLPYVKKVKLTSLEEYPHFQHRVGVTKDTLEDIVISRHMPVVNRIFENTVPHTTLTVCLKKTKASVIAENQSIERVQLRRHFLQTGIS